MKKNLKKNKEKNMKKNNEKKIKEKNSLFKKFIRKFFEN